MEATWVSINRWMDKDVVYIYIYTYTHTMEYYSTINKDENLLVTAMWMNLEGIVLSEWSQSQILYDITYTWNLKKYNERVNVTKKKQTQI